MARRKAPKPAESEPADGPADDAGAAETEARFKAWQDGCAQYRDDVARELAAAEDPAAYLEQLATWNYAAELTAAAP